MQEEWFEQQTSKHLLQSSLRNVLKNTVFLGVFSISNLNQKRVKIIKIPSNLAQILVFEIIKLQWSNFYKCNNVLYDSSLSKSFFFKNQTMYQWIEFAVVSFALLSLVGILIYDE